LNLLELDALGGSGSRGYGRVKFEKLTLYGLDGKGHSLDNVFRGHAFSRERPPGQLFDVIKLATLETASVTS
jgi:CRISPR-associated protein Csm3